MCSSALLRRAFVMCPRICASFDEPPTPQFWPTVTNQLVTLPAYQPPYIIQATYKALRTRSREQRYLFYFFRLVYIYIHHFFSPVITSVCQNLKTLDDPDRTELRHTFYDPIFAVNCYDSRNLQ